MVHRIITRQIGVAVAAAGLLAVAAPAASAKQEDSVVCAFTGVTGTLNPAVTSVQNDGTYKFDTNLGSNPQPATCTSTDADTIADQPAATNRFTTDIHSDGFYSNVVAGTGSVYGTACLDHNSLNLGEFGTGTCPATTVGSALGAGGCPSSPSGGSQATLPVDYDAATATGSNVTIAGYGIDFNAGAAGTLGGGALTPQWPPAPPNSPDNSLPDAYDVTGNVTITPATMIHCPQDPAGQALSVATFMVTGSFTAH
jgi:hypothetical protein